MSMKYLILFLGLSVFGFNSFAESDLHLIYVNGLAEKTIEPNMAVIRIESWAKALTAKAAQEQQAQQYANLKSTFEKFKINNDDIQTENFSVSPDTVYDQKTQVSKLVGYRAHHSVLVTYRKVNDVGALLDSLVTSKADAHGVSVQNISWDYDKKHEIETATLDEAVKEARSKAEDLAEAAGVSIKAVHKIQHTSYAPPVASPMYEKSALRSSFGEGAPATELSVGKIKMHVEVQMEFVIDNL